MASETNLIDLALASDLVSVASASPENMGKNVYKGKFHVSKVHLSKKAD